MKNRSAVILAGGKSERFRSFSELNRDKAIEKLFGKTLLECILESVGRVVDETIITVDSDSRKENYRRILLRAGFGDVDIFVDEGDECIGPLRGVKTGLRRVKGEYVITLPCDVPLIKPDVIDFLFKSVLKNGAAVPVWPNGRLEPLIGVFNRQKSLCLAEILCNLGRSRPDDLFRSIPSVVFISIEDLRTLDPDLESFVNINYPWDLKELPRVTAMEGLFKKTAHYEHSFKLGDVKEIVNAINVFLKKQDETSEDINRVSEYAIVKEAFFWAAIVSEVMGRKLQMTAEIGEKRSQCLQEKVKLSFLNAAKNFGREANFYTSLNIVFLAAHALMDEGACWRNAGYKHRASKAIEEAWRLYKKMGLDVYRRRVI